MTCLKESTIFFGTQDPKETRHWNIMDCLLASLLGFTALSAHIAYIVPQPYEIYNIVYSQEGNT